MKSAAVFLALVATASAFNAPMMATRAVGKAAPAASVRWTSGFRATMFVLDRMELKKCAAVRGWIWAHFLWPK